MTHSVSHTNDFQFTFDVLCFAAFTKRKTKKNRMNQEGVAVEMGSEPKEKESLIRTHAHEDWRPTFDAAWQSA